MSRHVSAALFVDAPLEGEPSGPGPFDAVTPEEALPRLLARGLSGAVVYPSRLLRAYAMERPGELLRRYNQRTLSWCAESGGRLKAVALLDVDDPAAAARDVERWRALGAAGVVLPLLPHGAGCYDAPEYLPLWTALEAARLPAHLVRGTCRGIGSDPLPFDLTLHRLGDADPLFDEIFDCFEETYARLDLVAMILSGVFARHPRLRVGTVGFGMSWAPFALMRLDEQYEVRPERAGDADQSWPEADLRRHAFAAEHRGFEFLPGEKPSDHFRRQAFMVVGEDELQLDLLDLVGREAVLMSFGAAGGPLAAAEQALDATVGKNAAALYGLGA